MTDECTCDDATCTACVMASEQDDLFTEEELLMHHDPAYCEYVHSPVQVKQAARAAYNKILLAEQEDGS